MCVVTWLSLSSLSSSLSWSNGRTEYKRKEESEYRKALTSFSVVGSTEANCSTAKTKCWRNVGNKRLNITEGAESDGKCSTDGKKSDGCCVVLLDCR